MKLVITTYQREDSQVTLGHIPEAWHANTWVAAHSTERHDWPRRINVPLDFVGCGNFRQAVSDYALQQGWDSVVFIDDDLAFKTADQDNDCKLRPSSPEDIYEAFHLLQQALDRVPVVGLGRAREYRFNFKQVQQGDIWTTEARLLQVMGFKTELFKAFRWDEQPQPYTLMSDYDMALQLLRAGIPNAVLWYTVSDCAPSNAPGGCSTFRTPEVMAEAARSLHARHPDFVRLVERQAKSWGDGLATRLDVQVAWKKAFRSGQKTRRAMVKARQRRRTR